MNIKNLEIFDEKRLKILHTIYTCKQILCGSDMVERLDIPKNLLSYHIKILKELEIIQEKKDGKRKFYKINPSRKDTVKKALEIVNLI